MNFKIIPKDKEDLDFIESLFSTDIKNINDEVPLLLEWIKDGNWPQAQYICRYFIPHINKIEKEIITILNSEDEMWKYWLIKCILYKSSNTPSVSIMKEVKRLCNSPTEDEKEAEVDIAASELILKFREFNK